ncbi:uncharacterized protein B0T15DRAFT_503202 [Chaetomium strumarium]|uniref:Rrn9 domain-containing protein n=1 Tax=Chaetomium strumarium TaxID=1170767 RepID=A0AAJ0GUD1_9PEZI|nr:hypothetical protein B0T15DRAFT_503202 [Chaetomium strumarium]
MSYIISLDNTCRAKLRKQAALTKDLVKDATHAIRDNDHAESDSDDSDDSESFGTGSTSSQDIIQMIEGLKTDIQCLVALGPRFREPFLDKSHWSDREEAAAPPQQTGWNPVEFLTSRIRHRYPDADPAFAQILGQANWERAQRLYTAKEKNTQDATTSTSSSQKPVLEADSASVPPETVIESAFHDSGLGNSLSTANYAETMFSYHGTNGISIKIPPIPAAGRQGKPAKVSHFAQHLEEVTLMILPANAEPEGLDVEAVDSEDEPIMSSRWFLNRYREDLSDEEATTTSSSRTNKPSPTPKAEMASQAEPHVETGSAAWYLGPQPPRAFRCLFEPCPYWSTRESNRKKHMEKPHRWISDRGSDIESILLSESMTEEKEKASSYKKVSEATDLPSHPSVAGLRKG